MEMSFCGFLLIEGHSWTSNSQEKSPMPTETKGYLFLINIKRNLWIKSAFPVTGLSVQLTWPNSCLVPHEGSHNLPQRGAGPS
jgi:hypothetical protein